MQPFFKFPPRPTLPALLTLPLKLIPGPVHSTILTTALNVLFAGRIQQGGEFDFLRDRVLAIRVRDAKVESRWIEGRVVGNRYIEGHFEYIITEPTRWNAQ